MPSSNVRLSESAHQAVRELAERDHITIQTAVERAIEQYRRQRFLETVNQSFAALRGDRAAWNNTVAERRLLDGSLRDGLNE
jgi:hypothetical protein